MARASLTKQRKRSNERAHKDINRRILSLLRERQMRLPTLPRWRMRLPLLQERQLPLSSQLSQLRLLLAPLR